MNSRTNVGVSMVAVHPSAIIDPRAELGEGVRVGPYSIIEAEVVVGEGTCIGSHVFIARKTKIGKECQIYHGVILGTPPQHLGYRGEETSLEIGDRTTLREYCTIHRATTHRWKTVVGSDCYLMAYVHVAHDCVIGNGVIMANAVNLGGHIEVEHYANIGGMVPVHQFVRIGRHSFVGGGCRVPKDVLPYVRVAGEPIRVNGLNIVGLQRRGFSKEAIEQLRRAYRILFRSGLNVSQAVAKIEEELDSTEEIRTILDFIRHSERGIIR